MIIICRVLSIKNVIMRKGFYYLTRRMVISYGLLIKCKIANVSKNKETSTVVMCYVLSSIIVTLIELYIHNFGEGAS